MKAEGNKKYLAHRTIKIAFLFTTFGLAQLFIDLLLHSALVEFFLWIYLIYFGIDVIIFIFQFFRGRYARVSFSREGLIYTKYFIPEFIPWEKVVSAEETFPFVRPIRYYLVKVSDNETEKEYLIEKNIKSKEMMERFYFMEGSSENELRLPFFRKQAIDFLAGVIALIFLVLVLTAALEHKDIITVSKLLWADTIVLFAAAISVLVFFNIKRNIIYKVTKQGVRFKIDGETFLISWEDAQKLNHKVEYLAAKEYHLLIMKLNNRLDGKYDTLEVPVSFTFLNKLSEYTKIITE